MSNTMDYIAALAKKLAYATAAKDRKKEIPVIADAEPVRMHGNGFYAGFASRDITPKNLLTHTYWMAGYNIAKKITGFLDGLTMNAMWLDVGDGNGIVMLSCDLIGLTGYEGDIIRSELTDFCKETGCRDIIISCTHTHAGIDTMGYWGVLPKTGKDKEFMQTVIRTACELCREAYANRRVGKLFYGYIEAPELLNRWRQPYFSKAVLHRFRFVPEDGTTETWFLNFPAHPNTLGGKNRLLSADYPCYMRRAINEKKKTNIMYAVSAIGATDIGNVSDDSFARTVLGGRMLGEKAMRIENEKELSADMTVVEQHFVMPIDNPVLALANKLGVFSSLRCRADSQTGAGFVSSVTYLEIGGVHILTMPGEMFPELVWKGGYCDALHSATGDDETVNPTPLCEIFGDDNLLIFGVTNDMAGYALAKNDFVLHTTQPFISRGTDRFGRNHYHETNSCGVRTGEVIAGVCTKIMKSLEK